MAAALSASAARLSDFFDGDGIRDNVRQSNACLRCNQKSLSVAEA